MLEGKIDTLVNICYQTLFTLHNQTNVQTFFKDNKLSLNFDLEHYEKFKQATLQNYIDLCAHYNAKRDASEFLARFASFDGQVYLPNDKKVRAFVKYYYEMYEKLANEVDLDTWQKWVAQE